MRHVEWLGVEVDSAASILARRGKPRCWHPVCVLPLGHRGRRHMDRFGGWSRPGRGLRRRMRLYPIDPAVMAAQDRAIARFAK